MSDIKGLQLAVRFSYVVNNLRYCGPEGAANEFLALLHGEGNPAAVREARGIRWPHHDYHVLYVGPGNTAGTVNPSLLSTRDNCRVSWGRVVQVQHDKLLVMRRPLLFENNAYALGDEEPRTLAYRNDMLPKVHKDDVVAIHWGFATCVLDERQRHNLEMYSGEVRNVMNKWLKSHHHKLADTA